MSRKKRTWTLPEHAPATPIVFEPDPKLPGRPGPLGQELVLMPGEAIKATEGSALDQALDEHPLTTEE